MSGDEFVISQPAGTRTLALRESYMAIADGDACEAHLLNALERWYAYKLKVRDESRGRNKAAAQSGEAADADEALWVRMSASQWATKELLGIYNEKTVRTKLARLVERGYVLTRENPRLKWDRTPQWLLNRAVVQAAVNAWAAERPDVDLDPSEADEVENADSEQSDMGTKSTRTNVRMQSEEVPNQVGQNSALIRKNVRSNNTGILTQESSTGIQKQSSSRAAANSPASSGPDDDQAADAETQEGTPGQVTPEGDEGLLLTGNGEAQVNGTKLDQATGAQKVPAAAALAGESAILALVPVPRSELEARSSRDPVTNRRLRALMSCSNTSSKRLQHMRDQLAQATRSGLPREWFCRLTDAELEMAAAAAQADAHIAQGQMAGAGYYALERLIGEPLTLARLTGKGSESATQAPLGHAYEVKNAGQSSTPRTEPEPERPAEAIEVGTRWEHKKIEDKVVTIVDITGGKVELHNGETLLSYMLTRDYKRVN